MQQVFYKKPFISLNKLFALLTLTDKKHAAILAGMILVMAILDMLGVASIMPFIAILSNPELVETNAIFKTAYLAFKKVGVNTPDQFFFAFGILVFFLFLGSLAFKAFTLYFLQRFTMMSEYRMGQRFVESYLHQPYSWFLDRHSADLGKTILSELAMVINQALLPFMNLLAHGAVAIALLTLLIVIDPMLALTISLILTASYGLIYKVTSRFVENMGEYPHVLHVCGRSMESVLNLLISRVNLKANRS